MGVFPCVEAPELFFSDERDLENDKTEAQRRFEVEQARSLCSGCDYRAGCLKVALGDRTRIGIYGGTTTKERTCMRGGCRHPEHKAVAA